MKKKLEENENPVCKKQFHKQSVLPAAQGGGEAVPAWRSGECLLIAASLDFEFGRLRFGR